MVVNHGLTNINRGDSPTVARTGGESQGCSRNKSGICQAQAAGAFWPTPMEAARMRSRGQEAKGEQRKAAKEKAPEAAGATAGTSRAPGVTTPAAQGGLVEATATSGAKGGKEGCQPMDCLAGARWKSTLTVAPLVR